MLTYKVVLKNKSKIEKMIIDCDGDINNDDNKFYIENAGRTITIDGYVVEEESFVCIEFPNYLFPLNMISHAKIESIHKNEELNLTDIGEFFNCSRQNISKIYKSALTKLERIISLQM